MSQIRAQISLPAIPSTGMIRTQTRMVARSKRTALARPQEVIPGRHARARSKPTSVGGVASAPVGASRAGASAGAASASAVSGVPEASEAPASAGPFPASHHRSPGSGRPSARRNAPSIRVSSSETSQRRHEVPRCQPESRGGAWRDYPAPGADTHALAPATRWPRDGHGSGMANSGHPVAAFDNAFPWPCEASSDSLARERAGRLVDQEGVSAASATRCRCEPPATRRGE